MTVRMKRLLLTTLLALMPLAATAGDFDNVIQAELLPGWRLPNGDHMAALHMRLAPGWKTYWRTPGDAGIPPRFAWRGARNTRAVGIQWPAPKVSWQEGMRSIVYTDEVILPLRVTLKNGTRDARLGGVIDIGICKDICLPHRLRVSAELPASQKTPDPTIAAAMADLPFGAEDAGISSVSCRISPAANGMDLRVAITMPRGTGHEETVIEAPDPDLWVGDPQTAWQGGQLVADTTIRHTSGGAFALDRSTLRITILGGPIPVEVTGCTG